MLKDKAKDTVILLENKIKNFSTQKNDKKKASNGCLKKIRVYKMKEIGEISKTRLEYLL